MILLINSGIYNHRKLLSHYLCPKQIERVGFNITSQRSCWVKKGETDAWWYNLRNSKVPKYDWKGDFQSKLLRVMYQIVLIFGEETESSKKPNVSWGSSGIIFILH